MSGIISSAGSKSGIIGGVDGVLLSSKTWTWLDGDYAATDGNSRVVKSFVTHTLNSSSTYVLIWSCWVGAIATSSTTERRSYPKVVMHTSSPGGSGTIFTGGTQFVSALVGRVMTSSSSASAGSYGFFTFQAVVPYGTSGLKYFGLCANSDGATNTATIFASGTSQLTFTLKEYKGDVDNRYT